MAKIPAWSWLAVGLIVAVTAWYAEMPLFFWLGWLFVAVGIAKFIIGYVVSEKTVEVKPQHRPAHAHAAHQPRAVHPAHQYYRCSCGAPVRASDNFCTHCGRRLR